MPHNNVNQNFLTALPFNHLDDGPLHFDADRLDTLLFNPIGQSHLNDLSGHSDTDINFPTRPPTSSYLVHDEVNAILESTHENACFSLLHINARSLLGKFDDIKSFVVVINLSL